MKKQFKKFMSPLVAITLIAGLFNVGYDKVGATENEKIVGLNPTNVSINDGKAILSYENDIVTEAIITAGNVSKTEEQTKFIPFSVDLELNNSELDLIREDLLSGMNIVYTCSFAKTEEYPIEKGMTDKGDLLTGVGEDLGDYIISDLEDEIAVTMILDGKSIYDLQDIMCGCTFEFGASLDAKKNSKTDITYSDLDNNFKLEYTYDEQSPDDTTSPYTITKDGKVSGNTITYIIDAMVNSTQDSLSNKVITDTLPQSLDYVSGNVQLFDANGLVETIEFTSEVANDVLTYVVPTRDYRVEEVIITLQAVLSSDRYIEYVANGENGIEVNNTVNLYNKNSTDNEIGTLLATATDTSKIFDNTEFFAKAGSQLGYLGHSMEWTITGNTYFTYSEDVYVVDYIPNCKSHKFSNDKNITITYDNFSNHNYEGSLVSLGEFDGEEYSYDNMNIDTIISLNITEPSYYDYNGGQVLIVPLDEEALNSPFTIKYYTDIIDITDNLVEGKDISNSAKIMWGSATSGSGVIGTTPFGTATVEKVLYFRAIKKSVNGNYDMDTQTVKFDISINECGNLLGVSDYTIVTDDLTDKGMEYTGDITLVLREIGGDGTDVLVELTKVDSEETCRNEVFTYCISSDNKILHVNLGNVTSTQNYVITIETKLTDPAKLATQATGLVLTNTATIEYGDQIREATASLEYANRWITKENVVGKYDYNLHGNKWKIVLNPHNLPLSNINITDILPADTNKVILDLVQIGKREYKLKSEIELINGNSDSFTLDDVIFTYTVDNGTIDFAINPINEDTDITTNRYDIYYTTVLSEDARINEDYVVNGTTSENKAVLTGDIKGVPVNDGNVASIEVGAKQYINLAPVSKMGKQTVYNSDNGVFETDWVIELNRDTTDFTGYTLVDVLADNLELYTDTLRVYKASVSSDGVFTKTEEIELDTLLELVNEYDRFSFKISEDIARTPMIVEFRTALTKLDGVGEQTVYNEVSLEKNGKSMVLDENVKSESTFYSEFTSRGYAQGIRIKLKKNEVLSEETSNEATSEGTDNIIETMPNVDNDINGVLNESVNKKPEILATMEDNTDNNSKDTGVSGVGVIKTGDDSISPLLLSFTAVVSLGVIISLVVYMSNKKKKEIVK